MSKLKSAFIKHALLILGGFAVCTVCQANDDNKVQLLAKYFDRCAEIKVCNGSFLVARNDQVLFSGHYGDNNAQSPQPINSQSQFDIGSISKQFTATAIVHLAQQGRLSLDDELTRYLPQLPYNNITLKQMLNHTSGLPEALNYYTGQYRAGKVDADITNDAMVAMLAEQKLPVQFRAGEKYQYNNTAYNLLAVIIEKVSKQPYQDYLHHTFFKPLGMSDTMVRLPHNEAELSKRVYGYRLQVDSTRRKVDQIPFLYLIGAGGIYSTADDLHRWDRAINTGKIISTKHWAQLTEAARLNDGSSYPYALGWSLKKSTLGHAKIAHAGHWRGFKADMTKLPEQGLTIIQLTNNSQDDSVDNNVIAVEAIMNGQPYKSHKESVHWLLHDMLLEQGAKPARKWFAALKTAHYIKDEDSLNRLGYHFLGGGQNTLAIAVFEMTAESFPRSANAHDSLAEAYTKAGQITQAARHLKKVLELDPTFKGAAERLESLQQKR